MNYVVANPERMRTVAIRCKCGEVRRIFVRPTMEHLIRRTYVCESCQEKREA
jgi:hypothetical protein